jgi:hypothetical protein
MEKELKKMQEKIDQLMTLNQRAHQNTGRFQAENISLRRQMRDASQMFIDEINNNIVKFLSSMDKTIEKYKKNIEDIITLTK